MVLRVLVGVCVGAAIWRASCVVVDEPGIHLHPKAQEDLKLLLRTEISKHMQVVLTTHLPGLVDTSRLDSVRGIVKNEAGQPGTWVINGEYSPKHGKITWDVMVRAIGAHGPAGVFPSRTVVTEGLSDRQYLMGMARYLSTSGKPEAADVANGTVQVRPGYGIPSLVPICQNLITNPGSTFVVLLDSDKAGDACKRSLAKKYPSGSASRGVVQLARTRDYEPAYFNPKSKDVEHELEDLLGVGLYSRMVNHVFADVARPFNPTDEDPPSMLEKKAKAWLESMGKDPESIYKVADSFWELIETHIIKIPDDVTKRFITLLSQLSESTTITASTPAIRSAKPQNPLG